MKRNTTFKWAKLNKVAEWQLEPIKSVKTFSLYFFTKRELLLAMCNVHKSSIEPIDLRTKDIYLDWPLIAVYCIPFRTILQKKKCWCWTSSLQNNENLQNQGLIFIILIWCINESIQCPLTHIPFYFIGKEWTY